MRVSPWLLPWILSASLCVGAVSAWADTAAEHEQHEALDDAALEETYGIKAGAVRRDEQPTSQAQEDAGDDDEEHAEGGTGGTGSADDAMLQEKTNRAVTSKKATSDTGCLARQAPRIGTAAPMVGLHGLLAGCPPRGVLTAHGAEQHFLHDEASFHAGARSFRSPCAGFHASWQD